VIIPENLTETLNAATKSSILLLNNPENTALSATITQSFDKLVNSISQQLATKMISKDAPSLNPEFLIQPLEIQTQNIVSGGQSPFDFVAPGFIGLGVMMSGLTGVGAALSREREIGTMDGLLMAPIYRVSIILGKILAQSVRNLFQGALIIVLAVFLFGINIRGDPLLIATIVMLGMLSFLGFGILVTSIAKEQESAQIILSFIQFPMLFLSGVLFPLEQMPIQLQYVARILPLTYAVDALRKVMVLGAGFNAVAFQLLFLTTLSIVTIAIGVPVFERAVRR
jgi:ABC-2 type transport system permease protein